MDCIEAERQVSKYIDHTLTGQKLEEFLEHVENCPSCYDELETYFIVDKATRHLSQEEERSALDFREALKEDIRKKHQELFWEKVKKSVRGTLVFLGGVAGLAAFIYWVLGMAKIV